MRARFPVFAATVFMACAVAGGCGRSDTRPDRKRVAGGSASRGLAVLEQGTYGCGGCHAIPGVRGAIGVAGPPLGGMARRGFIAGQLPNTPGNLVAFLQDPPVFVPGTGMPDVRMGTADARDVAAYLYTLEPRDGR
ncbi:MAG: c-type cytochrome [Longimicrobiaceae bacterium]